MVTDWSDEAVPMGLAPSLDRNPDNSALLMIRRFTDEWVLDLAADADGAVRSAIMRVVVPGETTADPGCSLVIGQVSEGRFIQDMQGHDAHGKISESLHRGALGGPVDSLAPTVVAHYLDGLPRSWYIGAEWIARVSTADWRLYVSPWSMATDTLVTEPATDPENLHVGELLVRGPAVFWTTATAYQAGINVWTEQQGAVPFIRWVGDATRGAADLGTDGVDMVWAEGEGKQPNETQYPSRSIMTAPFTTNPAAVEPRRLRSQPYAVLGSHRFVVGCGYAMQRTVGDATLIVRIADGVSWTIPSSVGDFVSGKVIGLTCDEAFLLVDIATKTTIARIRLDSLGPGTPPD